MFLIARLSIFEMSRHLWESRIHDHEWVPQSPPGCKRSERAHSTGIEVPSRPRADHFSSFLKEAGLYAQEVTSNGARVETFLRPKQQLLPLVALGIGGTRPSVSL